MFNFLKRERPQHDAAPVQSLAVDFHSHLLPGLDDGVESDEEALQLIRGLLELGFQRIITTPHIYRGNFNNSPETILPALHSMKRLLKDHHIEVELDAAAEYFFDEYFIKSVEEKQVLTLGSRYILFELAFGVKPTMLEDVIFKMNVNGYRPMLAHPERYLYFQEPKLGELKRLKQAGVFFQLNTMALSGLYGNKARDTARALIKNGMYEFAGSDIHRVKQLPVLQSAMNDKFMHELIASGCLLNNQLQSTA